MTTREWLPPHLQTTSQQVGVEAQQRNSQSRGILHRIIRSKITWILGACALFVWKCGVPKINEMREDKRRNDAIAAEDERAKEDADKMKPRDALIVKAKLEEDPDTGSITMHLLDDEGKTLKSFAIDGCGEDHPVHIDPYTTGLFDGGVKITPLIRFDAHGREVIYKAKACEPIKDDCKEIKDDCKEIYVKDEEIRNGKEVTINAERVSE